MQGQVCPWWRNHDLFSRMCEAMRVRCCAGLGGAEAGAFSAQPLCILSSGASREDPAQAGCAEAFDMVDAHTGSPPCRKAVHSKACTLRGAGTLVAALRLCTAPIAVRCESFQKHDKKDDRCVRSQRGACHSRHSFAVPVGSLHSGAVLVLVSGLSVQCWELHGPNPHHSLCRGGAVHSPHHHLHLDAVQLVAVRGVAHCSRPVRRWTTPVQGVQSPH